MVDTTGRSWSSEVVNISGCTLNIAICDIYTNTDTAICFININNVIKIWLYGDSDVWKQSVHNNILPERKIISCQDYFLGGIKTYSQYHQYSPLLSDRCQKAQPENHLCWAPQKSIPGPQQHHRWWCQFPHIDWHLWNYQQEKLDQPN